MARAAARPQRTVWIWILIVLAVVAGLLDLIDAARYMGWLPIVALGPLNFALPSANWLGALLSLGVALIWFWAALMLYRLDPRGWLFVVAIAVINLIFLALALFGQTTFQAILPAVAINAIALILGLLPSTKDAFGQ